MAEQLKHDANSQLADVIVEDILATSDKDLVDEIAEDYGDPRALSIEFDMIVSPMVEKSTVEQHRVAGLLREPAGSSHFTRGSSEARRSTGQGGRSLGRRLEMFLRRAFAGVTLFPGTFGAATASLAAVVLVAGAAFLLVKQFSYDFAEQTASSTSPSRQQPSLDSRTNENAYFAEVATGRSETEAQANYRSLQERFPSLLGARNPVIRLAVASGTDDSHRYVAAVGPFTSMELARKLCDELKPSGAQCTTGEYIR
jgi:hypothetical protein